MNDYENMGPGELMARLEDWMQVATDRSTRIVELEAERDRLRQLVRDIWAAWNDDTIRLHRSLMADDDGLPVGDLPTLDLPPGQMTLLDETIRWAHGARVDQ